MRTITWLRPGITESLAALAAATVVLAGCVSAGTQAVDPAERASIVEYRAAERAAEALAPAAAAADALVQVRAGERASRVSAQAGVTTADEARALAAFRAGERATGTAAVASQDARIGFLVGWPPAKAPAVHGSAGSQGRYAR